MSKKTAPFKIWVAYLLLIPFIFFVSIPNTGWSETWNGIDRSVKEDGTVVYTSSGDKTIDLESFDQGVSEKWEFNIGGNLFFNITGNESTTWSGRTDVFGGALGLFNRNGVHFASSSEVNLHNADFVAGAMRLADGSILRGYDMDQDGNKTYYGGYLLNEGKFSGAGNLSFVGRAVENRGTIELPANEVTLAGGNVMTVGLSGDNLVSVVVDEELKSGEEVYAPDGEKVRSQIKSGQLIQGHKIKLDAKGVDGVFEKAINLTGEVKTVDVGVVNGEIVMMSMDDVYNNAILEASKIQIQSKGEFENKSVLRAKHAEIKADGKIQNNGIIEADLLEESGYTFINNGTLKGWTQKGKVKMKNADGAAYIRGNIGSDISDEGDLIIDQDVNLLDFVTFTADDDGDGVGLFYMYAGTKIDGGANYYYGLNLIGSGTTPESQELIDLGVTTNRIENLSRLAYFQFSNPEGGLSTLFYSDPLTTTWDVYDFRFSKIDYFGPSLLNRFTGSGTELDPFMIYDVYGLQASAQNSNYFHYNKLANDIDAASTAAWNNTRGFNPIGNKDSPFYGHFDGDGHEISGLFIDKSPYGIDIASDVGLFGRIGDHALVHDLNLKNPNVTGYKRVGALAGRVGDFSVIQNVHVTGATVVGVTDFDPMSVSEDPGLVGGLVGRLSGTVTQSSFKGTVTGYDNVGGLVGDSRENSVISYSSANAAVVGRNQVGGLVGDLQNSAAVSYSFSRGTVLGGQGEASATGTGGLIGRIRNYASLSYSYSSSDVIGNYYVGGLIGNVEFLDRSTSISKVYSVGSVSGIDQVGGLFGVLTNDVFIEQAYFSGIIESDEGSVFVGGFAGAFYQGDGVVQQAYWNALNRSDLSDAVYVVDTSFTDVAGVEMNNTSQMKQSSFFVGFDFDTDWAIQEGTDTPYLREVGKHNLSNADTPAVPNSELALELLSKANFDPLVIGRDIFSTSISTFSSEIRGDPRIAGDFDLSFIDSQKNLNLDEDMVGLLKEVFRGFQSGSGDIQTLKAGSHQFSVDSSMLNLGDIMSLQQLADVVFKAEAKPVSERKMDIESNLQQIEIAEAQGPVRVLSQDGAVYEISEPGKINLQKGDQIWTAPGASLKIKDSKTQDSVKIDGGSAVRVNVGETQESNASENPPTLLQLAFGKISANIANQSQESSFMVQTPTEISGLRA